MSKVSIIVPCYNCSKTLEQAVESCYTQGLSDFEIIMVDDASTDDTKSAMDRLSKKHAEIRLFYHKQNLGGGAARNTGIRESTGDLIYCLDSDNFFGPKSLEKMVEFISTIGADGVVFYEQRFFGNNNPRLHRSIFNNIGSRTIVLEDVFNGSNIVIDNFLFTRRSYEKTNRWRPWAIHLEAIIV